MLGICWMLNCPYLGVFTNQLLSGRHHLMLARETLWHGLQKMALRFLDWIQSWLGVARNHPLHVTATRCHHPSPRLHSVVLVALCTCCFCCLVSQVNPKYIYKYIYLYLYIYYIIYNNIIYIYLYPKLSKYTVIVLVEYPHYRSTPILKMFIPNPFFDVYLPSQPLLPSSAPASSAGCHRSSRARGPRSAAGLPPWRRCARRLGKPPPPAGGSPVEAGKSLRCQRWKTWVEPQLKPHVCWELLGCGAPVTRVYPLSSLELHFQVALLGMNHPKFECSTQFWPILITPTKQRHGTGDGDPVNT